MSRDVVETIEDLEFLDGTGAGAVDAAARSNFVSAEAMQKWLVRHDRNDLWLSLCRRDPVGTHKSGSDRKRERLMSPSRTSEPVAALLAEAAGHDRKRIRNKSERISALIDDLREEVEAEREAVQIRDAARKDIERLEAELSQAKALLRGGSIQVAVGSGVSAADLRAWAARNGIACPPVGRVPGAVREAYEASEEVAS